MNNDFTHTEQLIRYLDKELPADEIHEMGNRLMADLSLQQELESLQLTQQAVYSLGIRTEVHSIHEQMMQERLDKPVKRVLLSRWARITLQAAASLVFILLTIGVYQYISLSPDKLYAEKYSAYTIPVTRGEENINPVQDAFSKQQYDKAILLFDNSGESITASDCFFAGQSMLALNNSDRAASLFQQAIDLNKKLGTAVYQEDAEYYLALSLLRNKEYNKAIPLFEYIHSNKDHLYHDKTNYLFMQRLKLLQWKNN